MRLCSYRSGDGERLGVVRDGRVTPAEALGGPRMMADLLRGGTNTLASLREAAAGATPDDRNLDELDLLAPVPAPGKVIGIGLNYREHATEQGKEPPAEPLIFAKFTSSVIGHRAPIRWDPALTNQVDYEAELAVVIGRRARRVSESSALEHVLGYSCGNDVSARDLQYRDRQFVRGKSLDTFCPLGPVLVTTDEIPDPQALGIQCSVNAETLQSSTTRDMIFGVAALIAYCSRAFTLEPGDVILTGTPPGVGVFRTPPRFLGDGDEVTIEIDGIGRLVNPCRVETPSEGSEPPPESKT